MFSRPRSTHLALGLLGLLLLSRPARAEDFEQSFAQAQRLYDNLEYEAALTQLEQARRLPHEEARDVTVSLYEGAILANLGRWEGARRAFRTALLKDPDARLLMLAPKVQRELEVARARVRKELALAKGKEPKSRPTGPTAPVTSPPVTTPGVATATPPPTDRPEQPPLAVALVPPPTSPAASSQALTPTVEARSHRGSPVPLVLLGAGVVAGGVGGFFGWSARNQIASARTASLQTEAATQLARAQGNARVANLLWGTAGVAVVGAAVSWLLLREPAENPSSVDAAR